MSDIKLESLLKGINIKTKCFATFALTFIEEFKLNYYNKEFAINVNDKTIFKGSYLQFNEVINYIGDKFIDLYVLEISSVVDGCINLTCAYINEEELNELEKLEVEECQE